MTSLAGLLGVFKELPPFSQLLSQLDSPASKLEGLRPLHLQRAHRPIFLANLFAQQNRPLLLITSRNETLHTWQAALETWAYPSTPILRFPEPNALPYERVGWNVTVRQERLSVFSRLFQGQHPQLPEAAPPAIILTTARALAHKTLPKQSFSNYLRVFKQGQQLNLEKMVAGLEGSGYERVSLVEGVGQFSVRGGIVDLFSPATPYPVRLELFGDEVDTVRYFDPTSQRTVVGQVNRVIVPPAREAIPALAQPLGHQLEGRGDEKEDDFPSWHDDLLPLSGGLPFVHLEYYLPLIYRRPASLWDYLPEGTQVVVDDWVDVQAVWQELVGRSSQLGQEQPTLPPNYPSPIFNWQEFTQNITPFSPLILGEAEQSPPLRDSSTWEIADFFQAGTRYSGQERALLTQFHRAQELEQRTVVVSRQAQRLVELWRDHKRWGDLHAEYGQLRPLTDLPFLPPANQITFVEGELSEGVLIEDHYGKPYLNLITDGEIYGWNRPTARRKQHITHQAIAPETYLSDIQPGDYIVHVEYGVGQFVGMVVRTIGGTEREYLQINYANNDTLYIPVHHADRLSKWIGPEYQSPNLHRVGEKQWRVAREQAQQAVNLLADQLLELYAAREAIAGHAFKPDTDWQVALESSFMYDETDDQLQVIREVKADMERSRPMDRLVCGDVGFGKTEVAVRAAFKGVMDGKQVAVLVPTTILAQQHYETFLSRFAPFSAEVGLLSRWQSPQKINETLQSLANGAIDVIIGTHRLLSDDVRFKDLGLVIIDEEQRFGVIHKERLKRLRTEVDVLTMTATPIPRTLYMGLSGLRDISTINTPPQDRQPVQTYVGQADNALMKKAILRELERGGQLFFVHNHVQTIMTAAEKLQELVPQARIGVGHGQMDERKLEEVMRQFAQREIDILVATTIIESGLDIPNANTLIVDRAEMLGLAQLYQLRGRVGRSTQRAYAYFFHSQWRGLTPEARARLETLEEHQELGAGYSIAMRDLEIRGAGELLGGEQSGHIANVGFDLYIRMLNQAVKARKAAHAGRIISAELPAAITIDLPLPSYIPPDFVPDPSLRLRLYRRMAALESVTEIQEMSAELLDRFGPLPAPIENLLYQLEVKVLANAAYVLGITNEARQIRLRMELEHADRGHLQHYLGPTVRVSKSAVWLQPDLSTNQWKGILRDVLQKLADGQERNILAPPPFSAENAHFGSSFIPSL